MWTVGLNVKIKVRFYLFFFLSVWCGWGLNLVNKCCIVQFKEEIFDTCTYYSYNSHSIGHRIDLSPQLMLKML